MVVLASVACGRVVLRLVLLGVCLESWHNHHQKNTSPKDLTYSEKSEQHSFHPPKI